VHEEEKPFAILMRRKPHEWIGRTETQQQVTSARQGVGTHYLHERGEERRIAHERALLNHQGMFPLLYIEE